MSTEYDCSELVGRRLEICNGTSGLPEETRKAYMDLWENEIIPETSNPKPLIEESGPGTELKKLLASKGLVTSADCGCNRKIRQMNKWGPDLCERKLDQIVNWLLTSAKSRKPWTKIIPNLIQKPYCRNLVKVAIKRSKS